MLAEKLLPVAKSTTAKDSNFNYVTMLLHGDGTNGAQNNTFVDSSSNAFTITRTGNTTQGTFTPYGTLWSNYFDGNSDYLTVATSSAFAPGTGDFTIEGWVYPLASQITGIFQQGTSYFPGSTSNSLAVGFTSSGSHWQIYAKNTNTDSASSYAINTWQHFALVRSGTTTTLYVNGASAITLTSDSTNYTGTYFALGSIYGTGNWMNAYVSNIRMVKGTAVYTGAFTPPTLAPLATSGASSAASYPSTTNVNTSFLSSSCSLLTCQSNRFVDNSSNAFAITVNGNPSVQRFSPFNPTSAYSTSVIGGSGYFDGSGDSLTTPSITLGTNSFCFECWFYPSVAQGSASGFFVSTANSGVQLTYYGGTGLGIAERGISWTVTESSAIPIVGQWNHVAFVRSSTSANQTSIFLNGVRVANGTAATNYVASTYNVGYNSSDAQYLTGYITDARLTVGSSPYSASSSTITIPTSPLTTSASNTSLLLNMTNAGIYDNAMMNDLETVGNAQISTAQKKFGTGSMSFNGSTDYLKLQTNPALSLSGDFTIEFWVYANSASSNSQTIWCPSAIDRSIQVNGTSSYWVYWDGAAERNFGAFTSGTWTHIALTRSGTTVKGFLNGTQGFSITDSGTLTFSAGAIGYRQRATAGQYFNGYIDDFRITNGYARYTSNFTAPTAALPNNG